MMNIDKIEEELKKELTYFVYQHDWTSECQISANYTGFHMINVFIEKIKKESIFKITT